MTALAQRHDTTYSVNLAPNTINSNKPSVVNAIRHGLKQRCSDISHSSPISNTREAGNVRQSDAESAMPLGIHVTSLGPTNMNSETTYTTVIRIESRISNNGGKSNANA